MRIALSSDERNELTNFLIRELEARGHTVLRFGAVAEGDPEVDWPLASSKAARAVASGEADEAIVCCWTGTGAAIAANKVRGIRAALCHDAETARGARIWNHANVLALSLRATSIPIAKEILDAWFSTPYSTDAWNQQQIARVRALETEQAPQEGEGAQASC
ncbi:MAG: RpiB/LacA/LacB family sugar-phosphate isomerase [Thermoflexales bacterium]|nr:RpiB/LacA/LacB family sugar-phosphate isomerase [Thermoflexales bacterium]MCS7325347.1 RpiB/LacA/LacB family sugar-phosphate isomerase [Thermoflexales bacterium]MCX7938038.1 RpiB/LacA/LacB family sugar-phosphate isomerase [Thermoflexales bacterium]MDW8054427.1 RpiB/LacA/LacB family sugar-phosphate isomerase [Anaerolineae bacterium]MDW8293447.1 RpiB/LacA/LacB family sugar-phosphate isomerase [Anaerolineae bacterium]